MTYNKNIQPKKEEKKHPHERSNNVTTRAATTPHNIASLAIADHHGMPSLMLHA
jgi:hypothetical protein